ncbi:MAG: D-alanyl-D-alanine carboxypeptidase family protein [Cellulosilyticaceae bacterium]
MRKLKHYLSILFICLFTYSFTFASPLPEITAEGAVLMDAKTGTILYAKNMNALFYPASTTKVLTCLILAEENNLDTVITKSPESIQNVPSDSSHIGLLRGDTYEEDAGLHGILMGSDNYISYDMAIANAGNIDAFAKKMNEKARLLGTRNTHFVNPHGYHDPDHYTTPYDMALITRAAFANDEVIAAAGASRYDFLVNNRQVTLPLKHTAALLHPTSPYYNSHVVAAKTGYHTPAGRTLVAKAVYDDITLIGVVMKGGDPSRFKDMNELFRYGSENFKVSGDETTGYALQNLSYSSWSKPYIDAALASGWIAPSIDNFQAPLSERTFIHLLRKVLPWDYELPWDLSQTSAIGPYKVNEPISGKRARFLLDEVTQQLLPTNRISITDALGVAALNQADALTLEQTLCILYKYQRTLNVMPPFIFTNMSKK